MKIFATLLLILLTSLGISQEYKPLDQSIDVKIKSIEDNQVKVEFGSVFMANIVLTKDVGNERPEIVAHYINYNTNKDLLLDMKDYGKGNFFIYIQYGENAMVRKIVVGSNTRFLTQEHKFVTYTDQYKIIIR